MVKLRSGMLLTALKVYNITMMCELTNFFVKLRCSNRGIFWHSHRAYYSVNFMIMMCEPTSFIGRQIRVQ